MTAHACVVSQRAYPGDVRLSTEILALQEAGYAVDVVSMRTPGEPNISHESGVAVYRIPSLMRSRAGKVRYVAEYVSFLIPALLLLAWLQLRKRYRLVHVTNLPDVLVFSALVPKLLGAKLIFDVRECTPEMFLDRFGATMDSKVMKLVIWLEQASIHFADATVTCTEAMRQALLSRGADPASVSVMLNVGSSGIFLEPAVLPDPMATGPVRLVTHGTIIRRYGHETLIQAMAVVAKQTPNVHLDIFGRGNLLPDLEKMVEVLGLQEWVTFRGFVPDDVLLKHLRASHIGVVPLLRTPEADLVHTFKMFEYIILGLPVIISRTIGVEGYYDEQSVCYFEAGNAENLAQAILDLAEHPEKRYQLAKHALKVYERYSPAHERARYRQIVQRLVQQPHSEGESASVEAAYGKRS